MRIEFLVTDTPSPLLVPRVNHDDDDDVGTLIGDVCEALQHSGATEFRVSGFGFGDWPVDVGTDLATALEQLPTLLAAVRSGSTDEFALEFYEQGLERRLVFALREERAAYRVRCESMVTFQSAPETEWVGRDELQTMLEAIRAGFMAQVALLPPEIRAHPWLLEWASETEPP